MHSTGVRVRKLRRDRGWSAQRLADECARYGPSSPTRGTIAKIESGVRKSVTTDELLVLARAFGVDPTELLDESAPETPVPTAAQPVTRRRGRLLVESLARAHQAALNRPLLDLSTPPAGPSVPSLAAGYIRPHGRVGTVEANADLANEAWWQDRPLYDDLETFFASYLASPRPTAVLTLVLGGPGSGKSVLAAMLAARLSGTGFVPILISLRHMPADAPIQVQIEHALLNITGERAAWPDFVRALGGLTPLILLDGVDELFQATGASQTDYLHHVAMFQRREVELGRPVAVVAFGRTVGFGRMSVPSGSAAVLLEPFDEAQIEAWIGAWNAANAEGFAEAGDQASLPPDISDLVRQPILLLIHVLATTGGEKGFSGSRAALYERFLRFFAERETSKFAPSIHKSDTERTVQATLRDLAIAALAMINRRKSWLEESELEEDLQALMPEMQDRPASASSRPPSGLAQRLIGAFFFIMSTSAELGGGQRMYTFTHPSFGDYLIASLLWDILDEASKQRSVSLSDSAEDDRPYAILSFAVLSQRPAVLEFLAELARGKTQYERKEATDTVLRLLRSAHRAAESGRYAAYRPLKLPITARIAAYTANLTLIAAHLTGGMRAQRLFEGEYEPVDRWHREVLLWRSQLPIEDMRSLTDTLRAEDDPAGLDVRITPRTTRS
jgi:transcriptional regulator with XRE-family HTH domain